MTELYDSSKNPSKVHFNNTNMGACEVSLIPVVIGTDYSEIEELPDLTDNMLTKDQLDFSFYGKTNSVEQILKKRIVSIPKI